LVPTDRDVFKAKNFWLFLNIFVGEVVALIYDDDQDVKGGWWMRVVGV
jgi:hypothetical protein